MQRKTSIMHEKRENGKLNLLKTLGLRPVAERRTRTELDLEISLQLYTKS